MGPGTGGCRGPGYRQASVQAALGSLGLPDSRPGRQLHGPCVACVCNASPPTGPVGLRPLPACPPVPERLRWTGMCRAHWSPRSPGLSSRTVEKDFIDMDGRTQVSLTRSRCYIIEQPQGRPGLAHWLADGFHPNLRAQLPVTPTGD